MDSQVPLSGLKVSHLMSSNLICIDENDSVAFVIQIFDRCHISGAPVKNKQGDYVGVISKTDLFDKKLLEYLKQNGSLEDLPVRYIMNHTPPMSVPETTTVEKASEIMLQHHIHRIFVHDPDEKIIGVVSSYDVLRVVASPSVSDKDAQKAQQILSLRDQLQKTRNNNNRATG